MTDPLLDILATKYFEEEYAGDYDGQDLVNALIILQQIAHSIAWRGYEAKNILMPIRRQKAEEFGRALREAVISFSGLDPASVVDSPNDSVIISLQITEK